jgi:hypothetical protein
MVHCPSCPCHVPVPAARTDNPHPIRAMSESESPLGAPPEHARAPEPERPSDRTVSRAGLTLGALGIVLALCAAMWVAGTVHPPDSAAVTTTIAAPPTTDQTTAVRPSFDSAGPVPLTPATGTAPPTATQVGYPGPLGTALAADLQRLARQAAAAMTASAPAETDSPHPTATPPAATRPTTARGTATPHPSPSITLPPTLTPTPLPTESPPGGAPDWAPWIGGSTLCLAVAILLFARRRRRR